MSKSAEDILEKVAREAASCTKCPLHLSRTHAVPGEGPPKAAVMVIGEGPGYNEDKQGRPFVGAAGKNLESLISRASLTRESVFITNIVKCRPPDNRRPTVAEAGACRQYLDEQIKAIEPMVIVLLGDTALKQFFQTSSLGAVHGKPVERDGIIFFPTYHPAAIIYNQSLKVVLEEDFGKLGQLLLGLGR